MERTVRNVVVEPGGGLSNGQRAVAAQQPDETGILSPSAYDRRRNPHRTTTAWSKGAIRVILTNPRYTGRQVCNKQRKTEILSTSTTSLSGMRPNCAGTPPMSGSIRSPRSRPTHRHRCTYAAEYVDANRIAHPRNVYLREDTLTDPLDTWLAATFTPHHLEQTITAMADTQPLDHPPATGTAAQTIITECDAKLERYRAALDAGADPAVITKWIAQTQAERARAEADLRTIAGTTPRQMSRAEITALITALGDITTVLRDADPADKAEVYRQLGLRLAYQAETQTVRAEVDLSAHRGVMVGVR